MSNGTRGGVKKAVVKAKVSAVKTKRKITSNENTKDEIDGLIEQAANDPNLNGSYMEFTPTRTNPKGRKGIAKATHQLRKVKSMVKHNSHSKLEEEPETPRRSTRNRNGASSPESNGTSNGLNQSYDEVGLEANEASTMSNGSQGPGLLKRTISKIWKMPNEVNSVASYDSMESQEASQKNGHEEKESSRSSCVIS